jgi:hypothetical protein
MLFYFRSIADTVVISNEGNQEGEFEWEANGSQKLYEGGGLSGLDKGEGIKFCEMTPYIFSLPEEEKGNEEEIKFGTVFFFFFFF